MVAGSFGTGDRLASSCRGPARVGGQEIHVQALGQQDVVAKPPGALDSLLPERAPCLRLAGEVARGAQCREGPDQQPVVALPAGELDRLFSKLPCRGHVNEGGDRTAVTSAAPNSAGSAPASGRRSAGTSSPKATCSRERAAQ